MARNAIKNRLVSQALLYFSDPHPFLPDIRGGRENPRLCDNADGRSADHRLAGRKMRCTIRASAAQLAKSSDTSEDPVHSEFSNDHLIMSRGGSGGDNGGNINDFTKTYLPAIVVPSVAIFGIAALCIWLKYRWRRRYRQGFAEVVDQAEQDAELRQTQLPVEDPESQYRPSLHDLSNTLPPPPAYHEEIQTRQKVSPAA